MSVTRGDSEILRGILLLRLGDVRAAVLAVVHTARCLPLGLLGKLRDSLDRVGDGKVVYERDVLLADQLDRVNSAELAQVIPEFLLHNVLGEVAQVDVS